MARFPEKSCNLLVGVNLILIVWVFHDFDPCALKPVPSFFVILETVVRSLRLKFSVWLMDMKQMNPFDFETGLILISGIIYRFTPLSGHTHSSGDVACNRPVVHSLA